MTFVPCPGDEFSKRRGQFRCIGLDTYQIVPRRFDHCPRLFASAVDLRECEARPTFDPDKVGDRFR